MSSGWGQFIQGARDSQGALVEGVSVDHGGAHIFVSQEFLNGPDVMTVFQEVGCEGMAEGVAGDAFGKAGLDGGQFHGALDGGFVEVVAAALAGFGVVVEPGGRKEPLPLPVTGSTGCFLDRAVGNST